VEGSAARLDHASKIAKQRANRAYFMAKVMINKTNLRQAIYQGRRIRIF
jgi:hypothetical protein